MRRAKPRLVKSSVCATIGMWLLLLLYLSPIYILLIIALKTKADFAKTSFMPTLDLQWRNLWTAAQEMEAPRAMLNSLIVTAVSIALILLFSSLAAYAIARRRARLYRYAYTFFLAGLMIPFQLVMLPLYRIIKQMGLMQTHLAAIWIYVGTTVPMGIVILTGFIRTIPNAIDEAALIDGASPIRIFSRIIVPLIKAPLMTVMIMCMVWFWNDLLTPMLFLGSKNQTLIVTLYKFKGAQYTTDWTMVFAGSIVAMLPLVVVFFLTQKYFIKGMVAGAVKG